MTETEPILLAEDNEDHILLMRHAFKHSGLRNPLHVVQDGDEAVAYLEGSGKYANRSEYPLPTLLLLDLKMPRRNGFEVLQWIRRHPSLGSLRIVVLTSSEEMKDVNRAYALGANSFLVKPSDFRDFVEMSKSIQNYWLWMSRTPDSSRTRPQGKVNPQ